MSNRLIRYLHTVFVKRALRHRATPALYWFSGLFFILAVTWAIDLQNQVLDLDEMDISTGVVKEVNLRWKTRCGAKLYLALDDGEVVKFDGCLTTEQKQLILGNRVKIWSQPYVGLFEGFTDHINQIKMGDRLIDDWSESKPHVIRYYRSAPMQTMVLFVLAFLPIAYIWFKNRRNVDC